MQPQCSPVVLGASRAPQGLGEHAGAVAPPNTTYSGWFLLQVVLVLETVTGGRRTNGLSA